MARKKLGATAIKALAPGEKAQEGGIIAERLPDGDVRWSVNIMVDGRRVHRTIGRASEHVTLTQAEEFVAKARTEARADRLDLPTGRKLHRTFAEAATEYLKRMEDTGGKNLRAKRRHMKDHLIPFFGSHRADRITTFLVAHYVRDRLASIKQPTVNRELATLSHAFRRFAEWKWIKIDDIPKIAKGAEPRKKITVLDEAQATALMQAAAQDQDPRLWLFVLIALNTAMRHTEILKIRYDQIDFANRRIHVPEAKAGQREQPITPSLAAELEKQRESEDDPNGWIFPAVRRSSSEPHRTSLAVPFRRAVVRAKLSPRDVTPHTLRHTQITRLVQAGIDLLTVQRISGHKTLAMVTRYSHIFGQHIDSAIAAIDTAFPEVIAPELHKGEKTPNRDTTDEAKVSRMRRTA